MSRQGIRFSPPRVVLVLELRWALLRAFGPLAPEVPATVNATRAIQLARIVGLSSRIGARLGYRRLVDELGEEGASELFIDRVAAEALGKKLLRSAEALAEIAAGMSLPLVGLKYLGLRLAGDLVEGSRAACDVDVLVPRDRAAEFHKRLLGEGYQALDFRESEQHLRTLEHPTHGLVEVHKTILGIRLGRSGVSATYEDLRREDLLLPVEGFPDTLSVPARAMRVAHALVHGLAQHGGRPSAYPMMQMVADLIDLGFSGPGGEDLLERVDPWIAQAVSPEEIRAARELGRILERGQVPPVDESTCSSPAGVLLRHIVAGRLDRDYEQALKLGSMGRGLTDRPSWVSIFDKIRRALFPTRGQIEVLYGRPKNLFDYLAKRLFRPIHLLAKLVRYLASYCAVRLRMR